MAPILMAYRGTILQILKKCQNSENFRILALFQILKFHFKGTLQTMQIILTMSIFLSVAVQIYNMGEHLGGTSGGTLHGL